ncbi:2,3-diaminopropionate biosynthesis protein SbnB [Streptosporangium sp. NBC_01755]|uniref:2,3-diaminopropionate biosynthesis protein SbnB n=1 Tax=unclassified Streptosporangium TaxID=2632669 RepID=UPI002DD835FA|nr:MULTISPECIES: 2,3-diaminopropionate biosynthesis protein SbnB [unclassified Streptosporangium]WSA28004.1 2,3-diaminopropionate biosynthesis protein SbnB [Streptosporangium sp. NBC_01810]WSD00525.1 2,3-diaminopropionate biosynthesis protein SbnB [Streptosporangium sp. NBC_01755]
MSGKAAAPAFSVISGTQVSHALDGREKQVVDLVEAAYRVHGQRDTVNPPSYFLTFPDRPTSRIIALPASLGGSNKVDGLKWISSFPENVAAGLPRASAVLILNDRDTGYPFACLESSIISASRTAASAALAADWLSRDREGGRPLRVGFFGVGLIARYIHTYLVGTGWQFDEIGVHDLSPAHMSGFKDYVETRDASACVKVHEAAEDLIRSSDLLVFATVAGSPHVTDLGWFSHNPLVLHVSLRDLAPEIILGSANVVDDVEHCLKANTSPHLAEQRTGKREFIDATLYEVMAGIKNVRTDRPVVFSPFGLGVLDLAVGKYVHDEIAQHGGLVTVDGFFHELTRYGKG